MITLTVNGMERTLDLDPDTPLLWALRDTLGLTGTKFGCGIAACGACTVLVDGEATRACSFPLEAASGRAVTTIEAMAEDPVGRKLQAAWAERDVPQCGYCQSGQIMAAAALLKATPRPSDDDIAAAMTNLCRCGTYADIRAAVKSAAGQA